MIKIKDINKKICKKITAFTLATSLSITNSPIRVLATDDDNMCYEVETLAEYKTIGGDYKVVKYGDNSIKITEINKNYENELTMDNEGNVNIKTQDKKHLGLFIDYKTYKFKIEEFNASNIDINDKNIDNENIKQIIGSLENYISTNSLNNENYIELLGEDLMDLELTSGYNSDEIKNISREQYNDTYYNYINDLNENGFDIDTNSSLVLGTALVGTLDASQLALAGEVICPETILLVALIAGLYAGEVYVSEGNVLSLDDIDYTYQLSDADLNDNTTWITLTDGMEIVENNYNDDDPNNDYYKAVISRAENNVYINFANPMSIEEAANLIGQIGSNVYTLEPSDAINVISRAGGIAGTSRRGLQYTNRAECHAFYHSYDGFDPNTLTYDLNGLSFKPNISPGVYYWHYHFLGKELNVNGTGIQRNGNHIFFGIPIIVTQNDIDKFLYSYDAVKYLESCGYINCYYHKNKKLKKVRS